MKEIPGSEAIKLRRAIKARKPRFRRLESWRYKRLKENWRRPRGLDNKMRVKAKGWPKSVNIGYGGPRKARGLHPSGYREVLVHTPDDVAKLDPETETVRIGHTVGTRKRIQIASAARERGVRILNPLVTRRAEEEMVEEPTLELEKAEETPPNTKQSDRKKKRKARESDES
ncbi:MAG: 50S ribosomal protein L32e [Candidatus Bathyarchaeota archaeon]|nr:MAG: 50S ribosomal protein L32e [Candidatus Bathyarchaeota archaeon]